MTDRGTGDPLAYEVWAAMRALVTDKNDRRDEVSRELGMTFVRTKALRRLAQQPMSLRELAAALNTDAPYTTVIVDDLEERGLARRSPHATDRRAKLVTLTPAGLAAAARAEEILGTPPSELASLPRAELTELNRILGRLVAADVPVGLSVPTTAPAAEDR